MTMTATPSMYVEISGDEMEAHLRLDDRAALVALKPEAVAALARQIGVVPFDLEEIERQIAGASVSGNEVKVLVARGVRPVNDEPVRVDFCAGEARAKGGFIPARAGQVVARLVNGATGADGVNVKGAEIKRRVATTPKIGANVTLENDGVTVKATADGAVVHENGEISVDTLYRIRGDVDFNAGSLDFPGDVSVGNTVLDLFKLNAGGGLIVHGMIEGAEVTVGKDIAAKCGISSKSKGFCKAGGSVSAKYILNATVEAGGDVTAEGEITNSRIICGGKLTTERGKIVGGHITATGGVACEALGAPGETKTVVEIAVDRSLVELAAKTLPDITERRKKIEKTRALVTPLLANQKQLTAQQKEKATELLFEAETMEHEIDAKLKELAARYEALEARASGAEVKVGKVVYPGVTLRIGGYEAVVAEEIRGPVRFAVQRQNHEPRVVAIGAGGHARALATREVEEPASAALRKEMVKFRK